MADEQNLVGEAGVQKKALRAEIQKRREGVDDAWIQAASENIANQVIALDAYQSAATVCLYLAFGKEVRLELLREECLRSGRQVLLPAYRADARCYGFKEWGRDTALVAGHWGVLEPETECWASISGVTCILVPGLAFDVQGGRVGYGAGHYDRLLTVDCSTGSVSSIGVCFDFQRVGLVPQEPWDRPIDFLVTERRTWVCRQTI